MHPSPTSYKWKRQQSQGCLARTPRIQQTNSMQWQPFHWKRNSAQKPIPQGDRCWFLEDWGHQRELEWKKGWRGYDSRGSVFSRDAHGTKISPGDHGCHRGRGDSLGWVNWLVPRLCQDTCQPKCRVVLRPRCQLLRLAACPSAVRLGWLLLLK